MRDLVIIGAGGHAREQLDLVAAINRVAPTYEVLGFLVDPPYAAPGDRVRGLPVLGNIEWLSGRGGTVEVVCGIGDPATRCRMVEGAKPLGARFPAIVHPSAVLSESVALGEGAIVSAGVVLSSDVHIGPHAHVNVGASLSHDCVLAEFVSVAPGARLAGCVEAEAGAQLGVGTIVSDRKRIGAWSITGAGAVVVNDVPPNTTVVGVPARVVKCREAGWHLVAGYPREDVGSAARRSGQSARRSP